MTICLKCSKVPGPSPCIEKWSGGGSHRVPKAREGGEHKRGLFPLSLWGVWGAPPRKFLNFENFYVRLNRFFMHLGPDFSRFGHKDISCSVKNRMLDKIVFRQSHVFFFFFFFYFFSACFFDIISSMSPQVLAVTFSTSTDPWWYYKELCFRKDMYTLSLASFQLEHPLRMQASSRF